MLPLVKARVPISADRSAIGLLLIDSSLQLLYSNDEALDILSYPEDVARASSYDCAIEKIRPLLIAQKGVGFGEEPKHLAEIMSGRRRYRLQMFSVKSPIAHACVPAVVVLLERGRAHFIDISRVAHQFRFTRRECEAVKLSIKGIPTRDIAAQMMISSNTVKTLLRFAMIKVGVSTRSAMLATILDVAAGLGRHLPNRANPRG